MIIPNKSNCAAQQRSKFSNEFKMQVLAMVAAGEQSIKQIAQEMGIRVELIYKWKSKVDQRPPGSGPGGEGHCQVASAATKGLSLMSLQEENRMLRLELERVRQQRDILKKTLGIVVEPPQSVTRGLRP